MIDLTSNKRKWNNCVKRLLAIQVTRQYFALLGNGQRFAAINLLTSHKCHFSFGPETLIVSRFLSVLSRVLPDFKAKEDYQEPGLQLKIFTMERSRSLITSTTHQATTARHTTHHRRTLHTKARQITMQCSTAHQTTPHHNLFQIGRLQLGLLDKILRQKNLNCRL